MIKRIELWLRRIVADEVGKTEKRLKDYVYSEVDRQFLTSLTWDHDHYTKLRDTFTADLKQFRADLVAEKLLVAAPQHWVSDEETRMADEQLRHPKPARR